MLVFESSNKNGSCNSILLITIIFSHISNSDFLNIARQLLIIFVRLSYQRIDITLGKIPLGFNEVIAMFPMLLAIGFLVYSFLLTQVMRLRIELKNKYQSGDPFGITKVDHFISFLGSLWIDPLAAKNEQRLWLTVLFAPFVLLFLVCLYMVIAIMFYLDNPFTTSDDLFSAATMINGYIFIVIDILGLAVVVYSYSRT
ncbi:MAG: hypothetical protein ACR2IS_18325, partial [Nitrososphaeraceae archaeon]